MIFKLFGRFYGRSLAGRAAITDRMKPLSRISAATLAVATGTGLIGLGVAAQARAVPAPVYHWCPGQTWDTTWGVNWEKNECHDDHHRDRDGMTTVAIFMAMSAARAALTNTAPKDPMVPKDPILKGPVGPNTPETSTTRAVRGSPGPATADPRPQAKPQSSYTVSRRGRIATPSAR